MARNQEPIHLGGPEFDRICRENIDAQMEMAGDEQLHSLMKLFLAEAGHPMSARKEFEFNAKRAKERRNLSQIRRQFER